MRLPDELEASLDLYLVGDEPEPPANADPTDPAWVIRDDRHAGAILVKLRLAEDEAARVKQIAADRRAELAAWEKRTLAPLTSDIAFRKAQLATYRARLERENEALPLTYKLPEGELRKRAQPSSSDVFDEKAAIDWAREHGNSGMVKTTYAFRVSALSDAGMVQDGGEWVDPFGFRPPVAGVVVVKPEAKFSAVTNRPLADSPLAEGPAIGEAS